MNTNKRMLIGFAVGWFVLMDILIRTSNAVFSALGNLGWSIRGGVTLFYDFSSSTNTTLILMVVIIATSTIAALLAFQLISRTLKVWYAVIALTSRLVKYLLVDDSSPLDVEYITQDILGEPGSEGKEKRFWDILRLFASVWASLLFLQLISSVMNGLFRY